VRRQPPRDGLTAPYVLLLAVGVFSFFVILLAVGQLIQGTAPWQHVSARARIEGVYGYDPDTGHSISGPQTTFRAGEAFAARVDWGSLPAGLEVGARWYDDSGVDWGGIQPGTAGELSGSGPSLVPMVRSDAPAGAYTLDVMRYSEGRPVQILGRTQVTVKT
jgi:hypothetical protein